MSRARVLDRAGLERVQTFERFASWCVSRFLSRYTIPPGAAIDGADLHAEAALTLCYCASCWSPERGPFQAYLAKAVQNRLLEACGLRQRTTFRSAFQWISLDAAAESEDFDLPGDVLQSASTNPEVLCLRAELATAVSTAVATLRPVQRAVVQARLAGDSTGDISRRLGCSKSDVLANERQALIALRPALEPFRD